MPVGARREAPELSPEKKINKNLCWEGAGRAEAGGGSVRPGTGMAGKVAAGDGAGRGSRWGGAGVGEAGPDGLPLPDPSHPSPQAHPSPAEAPGRGRPQSPVGLCGRFVKRRTQIRVRREGSQWFSARSLCAGAASRRSSRATQTTSLSTRATPHEARYLFSRSNEGVGLSEANTRSHPLT